MAILIGFDPGGEDGFGWCTAEYASALPLRVRATGIVDNAGDARREILARIPAGEKIVAAGIDSPLFWDLSGDRKADCNIRKKLRALHAPSPNGTVQTVNSLRGACLVQRIIIAKLLRDSDRTLPITESHPKALLWLLRQANQTQRPSKIQLSSLSQFLVTESNGAAEHERDAALATLSAWAMLGQPKGWRDLYLDQQGTFSPIEPPLGYWMPEVVGSHTEANEELAADQIEQQAVLRYSMNQAKKIAQENPY
jgi:hypothetical protein